MRLSQTRLNAAQPTNTFCSFCLFFFLVLLANSALDLVCELVVSAEPGRGSPPFHLLQRVLHVDNNVMADVPAADLFAEILSEGSVLPPDLGKHGHQIVVVVRNVHSLAAWVILCESLTLKVLVERDISSLIVAAAILVAVAVV